MCVILYNTCETGHIESSVLLSLSASCYNLVLPCIPITVLVKHFDEFNYVCFESIKLKKTNSKITFKKSPANCPTHQKSHRPVVHRPVVRRPVVHRPIVHRAIVRAPIYGTLCFCYAKTLSFFFCERSSSCSCFIVKKTGSKYLQTYFFAAV